MLNIGSIVWGVRDVRRAVDFWGRALDYVLKYPASDDWAVLVPRNGDGVQISFKPVTSLRARRHHIDLFADDLAAEVKRLLALGATRTEWRYEPYADYVVLLDPDGIPFCVVQK